ncbi:MAG TPA: YbaY family lipoprotein [Pyrinomonadaceae bacterium]|nr:YbaY family lipoprotein [Pyrinomonadaceae bacterium]
MKQKILTLLFTILLTAGGVFAQVSWLDRPVTNWNPTTGVVPNAPRGTGDLPTIARCSGSVRNPESLSDRAVTRAGWYLFGASQTYGAVTVINGMARVDGMCRPIQYNTFVFVSNRFAGTLSPTAMDSRTDGALETARLNSATNLSADFTRYTSSDALCCPSQTSTVSYTIQNGRVNANEVNTQAICQNNQTDQPNQPEEGVVRGTVTYRQRMALQRNSVITVRLVDISLTNAPSVTIAEQRIETTNQQVPIAFEIKFNPNRIDQRRRYAVQAEISNNGRTIFTTDKVYSVLTQGNSNTVDLNLVPIGSIGNNPDGNNQGGNNSSVIRGTITYLQRIALANNSNITVKLVDISVADAVGEVIAEDTFSTNNRQVPIPFELRYDQNKIDTRHTYGLQAEIRTNDRLIFRTDRVYNVLTRGNPTTNIELNLVQASETATPNAITGQTLNLAKFGTGSFQIEGRNNEFLLRGNVNVRPDGTAEVSVARFSGAILFTGKLTYFERNILRITVEKSGNANASGEIEITYNNNRLDSIVSNNLVIDNQKATIKF